MSLLLLALAGLGWRALRQTTSAGSAIGEAAAGDALPPRIEAGDGGVALQPIAAGLPAPTDLAFAPGHPDELLVLHKYGAVSVTDLRDGSRRILLEVDVRSGSEMGLLGIAFSPDFVTTGRFYLHHSPKEGGLAGEIWRWQLDPRTLSDARPLRRLLRVEQPYGNHDGGQLAFGPDGMLYVGFGDGGAADDPHDHGQNGETLLGTILRLDVRGDEAYAVPEDNPFRDVPGVRPEIYALGLRNPWRFSFTPDGRLVVADVGQGEVEEVDVVAAGDNLGWNDREGNRCFRAARGEPADATRCPVRGPGRARDPVWTYDHDAGRSITGGFVATGPAAPKLRGRYVCGDFVTGRLWALALPSAATGTRAEAEALGQMPVAISTFGRDPAGNLLLADYGAGVVYRLIAPGGGEEEER
ncbi:MAG: PQQ-dependent sugar dehydrogenase [Deltaproteobacteria bacterium]|nr:PQQ-dependent sugar dehydrogenase [Deltaproteobacteria bacterium]